MGVFFSLGFKDIKISDLDELNYTTVYIQDIDEISFDKANILYIIPHCHRYANIFPNRYQGIKNEILEKFFHCKEQSFSEVNRLQNGLLRMSVHIRRGDITENSLYSSRYTKNENIAYIVNQVLLVLKDFNLKVEINIYSQGDQADFLDLIDTLKINSYNTLESIRTFLDEDPFETFSGLVNADILVMSKSTFSYAAALLNTGVVIYEDFYHRPLSSWIRVDSSYCLNLKRLRYQVAKKIL